MSVLASCLVGGLVSNQFTALVSILVNEALFYFLSLCFTALISALCAVLAGNMLTADRRRARLLLVVGVSEVAAVLTALANLAFVLYPVIEGVSITPGGLGQQMTFNAVTISLVSGVTTLSLRRAPGALSSETRDGRSAALLVALALLLLIAGVVIDGMSGPVA